MKRQIEQEDDIISIKKQKNNKYINARFLKNNRNTKKRY